MKKTVLNYVVIAAIAITVVFIVSSCEQIKDVLYERYTVTFDLNYEGNPAATTVKVEEGKTVSEPSKPTRTGWDFAGWFKEASGRTAWNFNAEVVNSDILITNHWS